MGIERLRLDETELENLTFLYCLHKPQLKAVEIYRNWESDCVLGEYAKPKYPFFLKYYSEAHSEIVRICEDKKK